MKKISPPILVSTIIGTGAIACVLFTALTPPMFDLSILAPVAVSLRIGPARLAYWWRFALSTILLGLFPLIVGLVTGFSARSLGLASARPILRSPLFWLTAAAALAIGAAAGMSPAVGAYYPYARDLVDLVRSGGPMHFAGHLALYFFLYYVPWEFCFRGFLLLPFVAAAESLASAPGLDPERRQSASMLLWMAILFQVIPSTMLHFGHPLSELASAIPAGVAFGYLAYRSRSIVPGLILHAAVGFGTDAAIVIAALRVAS
ncbi:MAG: CPBP family intramembrane metalloprotease [Spirochaetales bacterium]|nr:MAG: CPBP family intramembrane metalloprotease [Spirochaetales bacterium]